MFSDLFDSEFKLRNKVHSASIVRELLTDGKLLPEEKAFLRTTLQQKYRSGVAEF
jgi:hypothetical protein